MKNMPDLEGVDLVADFVQVALREHQAHVPNQIWQDIAPRVVARALAEQPDGTLHHGVLAHEHR